MKVGRNRKRRRFSRASIERARFLSKILNKMLSVVSKVSPSSTGSSTIDSLQQGVFQNKSGDTSHVQCEFSESRGLALLINGLRELKASGVYGVSECRNPI